MMLEESKNQLLDYFLHIDQHLQVLVSTYGSWAYIVLFAIIFCETGLIIAPFLPGDSLLFAAGSLAALGAFNVHLLVFLLVIAAILGDTVNYAIGYWFGGQILASPNPRFFKKEYLAKAHEFYEKQGGKAIVLGRFLPIIRTFVPFVAGLGRMKYTQFLVYNALGALLWVGGLVYTSFWFGNLPLIRQNFSIIIIGIIVITLLPPVIGFVRQKKN